ncbi:MAG: methyltransferase [Tissierellia bacterium]|nr:methyltransferase [Tissierellia bacterium]
MAGAITSEKLKKILKAAGFTKIQILCREVSDEYAEKWGHGQRIKEYIYRGKILAIKEGEK